MIKELTIEDKKVATPTGDILESHPHKYQVVYSPFI